jgi:hypothetical protein
MALAFGAVLLIEEPRRAESSPAPESIPALLARPWRMLLARHGASAGFLLAALAAYAVAGSAADFLGRHGHLIDYFVSQGAGFDTAHQRVVEVMATQEVVLMLIGAVAGLLMAFRMPPGRVLAVSAGAWLAVVALFILCKAALGFTVLTVAGLFALCALIGGATYIMVWTVAARLTAPPDTAGQFALLAFLLALFSVSGDLFRVMSAAIGGYGIVAVAVAAALAAIVLIRMAARSPRRAG